METRDTIRIIMPTRGRPAQARKAIDSILGTCSGKVPFEIILCCDDDCPKVEIESPMVRVVTGPRKSVGRWINHALDLPWEFTWIALAGDDVRYVTHDWDTKVVAHPQLIVYGPDGFQNEGIATHPFIRAEIYKALGYLVPPALSHYCADLFLQQLGRELDSIAYDNKLVIEHLHPAVGKAADDDTYRQAMGSYWHADQKAWREIVQPSIPGLARMIQEKLK